MTGDYPPGTYTVTVRGTEKKTGISQSVTGTFKFTLVDPCSPPDSVLAGDALDDQ